VDLGLRKQKRKSPAVTESGKKKQDDPKRCGGSNTFAAKGEEKGRSRHEGAGVKAAWPFGRRKEGKYCDDAAGEDFERIIRFAEGSRPYRA